VAAAGASVAITAIFPLGVTWMSSSHPCTAPSAVPPASKSRPPARTSINCCTWASGPQAADPQSATLIGDPGSVTSKIENPVVIDDAIRKR
jgi:hypothetical protein